ncbi:MAG TPA: hypothetical protein VNS10_16415 [Gemmatimonadaceae bacterium]|nr:hypothetical protein [Gemmatimonadaceae bacterium]
MNPTPITTDRAIVRFTSRAASTGMLFWIADNATGTFVPNKSKQATKKTDITQKTAAKTDTPTRSPRAIPDASAATSPTVTTGSEANVIATVPNSHCGDRNAVGNQRNTISTLAITARISPTLPNAFHAVLGAVEVIGFNAFRSA